MNLSKKHREKRAKHDLYFYTHIYIHTKTCMCIETNSLLNFFVIFCIKNVQFVQGGTLPSPMSAGVGSSPPVTLCRN